MWKKIIQNNVLIENKIDQLALQIENSVSDTEHFGLMSGSSGKALFLAYYGRYKNDIRYIEKANELLAGMINTVNESSAKSLELNPLFSVGITGILWVIHHLMENDFMDADIQMFEDIDRYLAKQMMGILDINANYDFLHGSLGIANYLLKNKAYSGIHDQFVTKLGTKGILEDSGKSIKWKSVIVNTKNESEEVVNFGLSHGMASIIAYLGKYIQVYGATDQITGLLKQSIRFIQNNEQNKAVYKSFFPNWISEPDDDQTRNSGLRWCYGDLGIAYSLYKSGLMLKDNSLRDYSIQLALKTSERKDNTIENIFDAGLCHGTIGIAHIFNRLYQHTGNPCFKETAVYWYQVALDSAVREDGIAGFMCYKRDQGWSKNFSLLEGVSGIGLGLIAAVSDIQPSWDSCLLLS